MKAQASAVDRRRYLGGSDAAALLGVSEWRTPYQVYCQKTGTSLPKDLEIDPARLRMFRRGKLMEPVVIRMLQNEMPIKIVRKSSERTPNRYVDNEYPFLAAEIDFEWEVTPSIVKHFADNGVEVDESLLGKVQNGEVKTAHPFVAMKKFGEEGTDEIPIEYAAQAMHGLMVTDRQLCMFPVLVGSDNLTIYWVKRDEDLIKEMRRRDVSFWQHNVENLIPPDPIRLNDVLAMFPKLGAMQKEATPEVIEMIRQFDETKTTAKQAAEREEELKFELGKFLLGAKSETELNEVEGKHQITSGGKPLLTVNFQQQYRLNEMLVKVQFPKVAEQCARLSQYFVFNRNRAKK